MIYFKIKHKFFFGAFISWFAFVSLILPMKAIAADAAAPADPTGVAQYAAQEQAAGNTTSNGTPLDPTKPYIGADGNITTISSPSNPAAAAATNGKAFASPGGAVGDLAQQSITALGTCSIGAVLGRLLGSLIGQLINAIFGNLTNTAIEAAAQIVDCATHFLQVCTYSPNTANQLGSLNQKTTGFSSPAPSGIPKIPLPSLDSIMFCIVNEILTYITQATVNWINSGFNGNPVFVQNPGALLQTVADQEATNFISGLSKGASQGAGGIPNGLAVQTGNGSIVVFSDPALQAQLTKNLIGSYNFSSQNNPMAGISAPTLSSQQINALAQGRSLGVDVNAYQYDPRNTVIGQTWALQQAMLQRQAAAQQSATMRFNAGNGYIAPTTCAAGYLDPITKVCKNYGIMDTSSAHGIAGTLQNRDMMTYMRVALAKDFDSIITALVNQLIKIAVTDLYKKTGIVVSTYSTGLGANAAGQKVGNTSGPNLTPMGTGFYDQYGNIYNSSSQVIVPGTAPTNSTAQPVFSKGGFYDQYGNIYDASGSLVIQSRR
jgi:hypothetical protein